MERTIGSHVLSHRLLVDTVLSVKVQPCTIPAMFRSSTREGTQWRNKPACLILKCEAKEAIWSHSKTQACFIKVCRKRKNECEVREPELQGQVSAAEQRKTGWADYYC